MSFSNNRSGTFTPEHLQPAKAEDKGESCPIYPLLEVCAPLAGITEEDLLEEERFCGYESEKDSEAESPLGMYRHVPIRMCREISDVLEEKVATVEQASNIGDILSINEISQLPTSEEDKLRLASQMKEKRERKNRADEILSEWREVLYSYIGEADSEEYDFPGLSMEELTNNVVLEKVKKYAKALEKYKGEGQTWLTVGKRYPL
jgi:hypothetical protein